MLDADAELEQIISGGGSAGASSGIGSAIKAFTLKAGSTLRCAADEADKFSPAGLLGHIPGLGSGIGGFIVHALGGNTFSGATDLISSFVSGEGGGHSVFYNMGMAEFAGPTQGLGPALQAAGVDVTDSALGRGVLDAALTPVVGAEYATGVGEIKFGLDLATFIGSALACVAGLVR